MVQFTHLQLIVFSSPKQVVLNEEQKNFALVSANTIIQERKSTPSTLFKGTSTLLLFQYQFLSATALQTEGVY